MDVRELRTPAAIVDVDALERNAARMRSRCAALGVDLRPHVKTHKCVEIARLQLGPLPARITVSTLAEALGFADAGFDDIVYAVPLAPSKAAAAVAIAARLSRFAVLVEHPEAVHALDEAASRAGRTIDAFLEIDTGDGRTGVDPDSPEAVVLARRVAASPHIRLRGILTHAGQAYRASDASEVAAVAERERARSVAFADRLGREGIAPLEVSVGSTPTVLAARPPYRGVTEVRPGNYVMFDRFQAAIGSCDDRDAALTVLSTVIAIPAERGRAVLDAGSIALSADPGPTHVDPACGFGEVVDLDGRELPGRPRLTALSQEHGRVAWAPVDAPGLRVGDRVHVRVNHACLTAAQHGCLYAVSGREVVDRFRPIRGW